MSDAAPTVSIPLTVGVELVGQYLNTYLFGLVTYQFIVYYSSPHHLKDPFIVRLMVGVLAGIDLLQTTTGIWGSWDECVTNYGKPESLARVTFVIPLTACATAVVASISQTFLSYRAYKLTNSKVLFGFLLTLSFGGLLFGLIAGIRSGIVSFVADFPTIKIWVILWLTFQTAADIFITGVLTYSFSRSKTGFRRTDSILNRLIRGAIQTGFFVSIFAIGDLLSFCFAGNTNLYAMFAYPMGRIYTNTLLDTLNCRSSLQQGINTFDTQGNPAGTYHLDDRASIQFNTPTLGGTHTGSSKIKVNTLTSDDGDRYSDPERYSEAYGKAV